MRLTVRMEFELMKVVGVYAEKNNISMNTAMCELMLAGVNCDVTKHYADDQDKDPRGSTKRTSSLRSEKSGSEEYDRLETVKGTVTSQGNCDALAETQACLPGIPEEIRRRGRIPRKYTLGFLRFWDIYPYRMGKGKAAEAWERLGCNKSEALTERVIAAAAAQAKPGYQLDLAALKSSNSQPPYPSTWLNQGRYDDDPIRVQRLRNGGAQNFESANYGESE